MTHRGAFPLDNGATSRQRPGLPTSTMTRYATTTDLVRTGIAAAALTGVSTASQEAALDAASAVADGYLCSRYTLPLSAWGADLTGVVARMAAWDILRVRGYDPQAGGDAAVRLGYTDSIKWLEGVQGGRITPQGVVDATPSDEATEQTSVITNRRRNWLRGR